MSDQDYDIQEAFRRIELELIASMKRNLSKHQEWETKEGINWNMWQAEQLKDMRRFQQQNEKIFGKRFVQINNRVQNLLKETAGLQDFEQERQSLEEMINNPSLSRSSSEAISGGFFGINDRRMMALIKSTGNDLKKAEHAMLRMTNDQYRKVIFNAQTYFNSGAGTLDKAIDMATDEFLKRGINCIEYKDGRRVNIATYAEMALRTANKRAGLMADGDKRAAMGIHLVKISSYGACSPTCMPWQGRIYVDDVYSGGTKEEAKKLGYPLLSRAMEGGLFHPNCRHTASTYYPGLDLNDTGNPRDDSKTVDLKEHPDAERYHNYYQNLIQREKRLQVGSLDEEKIQMHADREQKLVGLDSKVQKDLNTYYQDRDQAESVSSFIPAESIEEAQEYAKQFLEKDFMDKTFKGEAVFKGISLDHANEINRALTDIYTRFPDMKKISGIRTLSPTSAAGKKAFKDGADAVFSYDPIQHGININKDILKNAEAFETYKQRSKDAWDLVMNNLDKLSPEQRELAEVYKTAGRELVAGDTIQDLFTHEMGHHVQWTVLDTKTNNLIGSKMSQFAPHISGYANANKSEYLAESFVAYVKGETDLLDPEYIDFLNSKTTVLDTYSVLQETYQPVRIYNLTGGEDLVTYTGKQMSKKAQEHCKDYGLDVTNESDRYQFIEITRNIVENKDEVRAGPWRGQKGECKFYIKGDDVVIVNENNEYVTTMKGRMKNVGLKNTRKL